MMEKETYWSKFADDFEERTNNVIGKSDIELIKTVLSEQKTLGKTLELGCGNGTYSEILVHEAEHLTHYIFTANSFLFIPERWCAPECKEHHHIHAHGYSPSGDYKGCKSFIHISAKYNH